jgi:hypothetical protein
MEAYELSNILFLKGVRLIDCEAIEDAFEARLMQRQEEPEYYKYDKIPPKFTTIAAWPRRTNLKCWWCDRTFSTVPLFMPVRVAKYVEHAEYTTHGNFDKWQCVAAYMERHFLRKMDYDDATKILMKLYKIFTGATVDNIPPAPPRTNMEEYGGNMTVAEWEATIPAVETYDNLKMHSIALSAGI